MTTEFLYKSVSYVKGLFYALVVPLANFYMSGARGFHACPEFGQSRAYSGCVEDKLGKLRSLLAAAMPVSQWSFKASQAFTSVTSNTGMDSGMAT
jgi:hypothetical protein